MGDGIDVGALVSKIRDHRFDGYSYNMLADEVQAFRNGDGIGGISSAVDALKAVAGALDETDGTLRDQLGKLGVVWTSTAGGQAGVVFAEHAGFSSDATTKVNHAAEMIFAQGEAFNRALHRLPDTATLRTGAGSEGYSFGDSVAGLFGFETDHATAVRQANEARQQAVDALNEYARASGENLASTEEIGRPETLGLTGSGDPSTGFVASDPSRGSGDDPVLPQGGGGAPAGGGPVPPPAPGSPAPHGGGSSGGGPVIAPIGLPPAAPEQTTRPSGGRVPHRPSHEPPAGSSSGSAPVARAPIPDRRGTVRSPVAPASQPGFAGGIVSGPTTPESRTTGPRTSSPSRTGGPGGGAGGGTPGGGEAVSGHAASGGPALAKGRVVSSVPQPPVTALSAGAPFSTVPSAGFGGAELGAGITALGAAGAGGAVSGEPDRNGKGFAKGAPSRSAKAAKQIPMDDLPEEEAKVLRKSGHGTEPAPAKRGFLERAAERDTEDGKQVRRFGVDDKDLFTDQREVPPGTIADGDESRG